MKRLQESFTLILSARAAKLAVGYILQIVLARPRHYLKTISKLIVARSLRCRKFLAHKDGASITEGRLMRKV